MKSHPFKLILTEIVPVLLVSLMVAFYFPIQVSAVCTDSNNQVTNCNGAPDGSTGIPAGNSGNPSTVPPGNSGNPSTVPAGNSQGVRTGGQYELTNPLGGINSISDFIQRLLTAVVAIGVPIAVLFIVLAGFKFITAQGNPEELAKARRNFFHVVIGVAIFIGAWALSQLIAGTLRSIGVGV